MRVRNAFPGGRLDQRLGLIRFPKLFTIRASAPAKARSRRWSIILPVCRISLARFRRHRRQGPLGRALRGSAADRPRPWWPTRRRSRELRPLRVPVSVRLRRVCPAARTMNTAWKEICHFAALDWADDHHDVCVVDQYRAIATQFRFRHSAQGWNEFREKVKRFPHGHRSRCRPPADRRSINCSTVHGRSFPWPQPPRRSTPARSSERHQRGQSRRLVDGRCLAHRWTCLADAIAPG